jgi:hypothetical protein
MFPRLAFPDNCKFPSLNLFMPWFVDSGEIAIIFLNKTDDTFGGLENE